MSWVYVCWLLIAGSSFWARSNPAWDFNAAQWFWRCSLLKYELRVLHYLVPFRVCTVPSNPDALLLCAAWNALYNFVEKCCSNWYSSPTIVGCTRASSFFQAGLLWSFFLFSTLQSHHCCLRIRDASTHVRWERISKLFSRALRSSCFSWKLCLSVSFVVGNESLLQSRCRIRINTKKSLLGFLSPWLIPNLWRHMTFNVHTNVCRKQILFIYITVWTTCWIQITISFGYVLLIFGVASPALWIGCKVQNSSVSP